VYAPATCGAALVFIEAALSLHIEVTVLLPFDRQEFVDTCVAPGGAEWRVRFETAMAKVTRVVWATEEAFLGDDVLFQQGASMLAGLARLRSDQLETTVSRVAMPRAAMALPRPQVAANPSRASRTIKALLFGDVAGFSRLNDAHAPLFHARFLQVVAEELDACAVRPLETNTWGDALYVVFDTPAQAADFALRLMQRMLQVDWAAVGLTPLSQVRIGLHAGPVYCGFDPIIERDNYFGSSVTKTARIEPVTPPGMVYVSEAFAAQLAANSPGEFTLEYMGELTLAKGYGKSRIYRLARPQH
jgi:adenylate cyclase